MRVSRESRRRTSRVFHLIIFKETVSYGNNIIGKLSPVSLTLLLASLLACFKPFEGSSLSHRCILETFTHPTRTVLNTDWPVSRIDQWYSSRALVSLSLSLSLSILVVLMRDQSSASRCSRATRRMLPSAPRREFSYGRDIDIVAPALDQRRLTSDPSKRRQIKG